VRAVHNVNFLVRQLHAGIEFAKGRIVPFLDLAEVDVGQHRAGKAKRFTDLVEIVDGYDRTENQGHVNDFSALVLEVCQSLVAQWTIGASKINLVLKQVLDPQR